MTILHTIRERLCSYQLLSLHLRDTRFIERWQTSHAQQLIRHAIRHVPAYTKLYASHGICHDSIACTADIERLPTITKDFFIGRPLEEYSDNSRSNTSAWKKTSGTSGKPFAILIGQSAFNYFFVCFARYRFLYWESGDMNIFQNSRIVRIGERGWPHKNFMFIQLSDFRRDPQKAIRAIAAFQPDIIATFPSIFLEIARVLKDNKSLSPVIPRYAVSYGEMLSPITRHAITEAFSADVYDQFGLTEVSGSVAIECKNHDGMHVNSESVIVEVVDEHGRPVQQGESGAIIVTDLTNYTMPIIRYETGDHGVLTREPCACGLKTPRIWIEGRYSAYLSFGDKNIHHLEFDNALDGFINIILQYQIVKRAEDRLLVRIVPGPRFKEADCDLICKSVRAVTGERVAIEIEPVLHIARTERGKSLTVTDESVAP